jgi:hypothetical protein
MSDRSRDARPQEPTGGRACDAGQLGCHHYQQCAEHCSASRYHCQSPTVGWRWFGVVARWVPVCESHFYVRGLNGHEHRIHNSQFSVREQAFRISHLVGAR